MMQGLRNWSGQIAGWALSFTVFEQIGAGTVLAVLLTRLGASPLQIGLLIALVPLGMAAQALVAPVLEASRSRKRSLIALTVASSVPYLVMALGVHGLAGTRRGWAAVFVLGSFAAIALISGVREVAFFELAGATVREGHRGRFFGLRDAVTGGAGILGGMAVFWTLSIYGSRFPRGYVVLLVGSFVVVCAAGASLLLSADRSRPRRDGGVGPLDLVKRLPSMLSQDRHLGRYLLWRTLVQAARGSHAFLIVFALAQFALGDEAAGVFILVTELTRLVAGVPCGWLADRLGPRAGILAVALIAAVLTSVAMVVAELNLKVAGAYAIFSLFGLFKAMWFSADSAMVLNLTTPELHLRYVSLARLVPLPATLVAPVVMGFIAGRWGYGWTFALGTGLALGALLVGLSLRPGPAGGQAEPSREGTHGVG